MRYRVRSWHPAPAVPLADTVDGFAGIYSTTLSGNNRNEGEAASVGDVLLFSDLCDANAGAAVRHTNLHHL
jgi:hypothetical protein